MQLNADNSCALFDDPRRPQFCRTLQPTIEMCGETREYALTYLADLERQTGA